MQSRKNSFIESLSQVVVGYAVAVIGQLLIFPIFDISVSLASNLIIGLWFAIIAVAKSYAIRRWFNNKTEAIPPYDLPICNEENLPASLRRQAD